MLPRSVHATTDECTRRLPGDQVIRYPADIVTHAVTVHATRDDLWPWLARTPAPLAAGMLVRGPLGAPGPAEVITFEPGQFLVLGHREHNAEEATWSFVLEPAGDGATRLIVRARGRHAIPAMQVWRQRRELRHVARRAEQSDALLDRFLRDPDAVHQHAAHVSAPAGRTIAVALAQDFMRPRLVRLLIGARAWALGAPPAPPRESGGLVADMEALGWGVLADVPGREIVMGAATRPWEASPVFEPLPGAEFAPFSAPGYVKIVWSLRVDPDGPHACFLHTETRAVATDADTRRRFAIYWALVSRGTSLIRRVLLASIRREAEQPADSYRRAS